ncbi:unnamed protein product [Heligmosomoides polygyrus]|uniref:RT_RNaseH_2 domain-containing protein n=1 Tax=Heligmosomoides polygyrus TaxID=6339 RepID=A0A183F593_HELPZ|nr:unnamed protein product [Heligmosomoides polygyrus]
MGEPSRYEDELLRTPEDDEMINENEDEIVKRVDVFMEVLEGERQRTGELEKKLNLSQLQAVADAIAIDFKSIAPEVLREFAERKLRERSRNATIISHSRASSDCATRAINKGDRPFIIYTNASGEGLGAVLRQEGEDKLLHPISFASRGLSKAEKGYHITDLETLALLFALKISFLRVWG